MTALLRIEHFTDPTCPWAFSAEPTRWRLLWLYGDQLAWEHRMVVLSERPEDPLRRGFTPEKLAAAMRSIQRRFGMPIDSGERPRMYASEPACRVIVAGRLRDPALGERLLRRFRVACMAGELIDEPEVIARCAEEAGLDPAELPRLTGDPAVEEALAADQAAARDPSAAALVLDHKLAGSEDERRYTCPSYVVERPSDGVRVDAPGFQPVEAYEVVIANLAPDIERRAEPASAEEVLAWAGEPLATAEVAAVLGRGVPETREELARFARERPVGPDGYWALAGSAAPRLRAVA